MEDPPRLRLPDDVLADVLAGLAPRSLAMSRCVCREWRAVVDDRRLLHPDLLPLTVGGICIESCWPETPDFFVRPSTAPSRWVARSLKNLVQMDYGFDADSLEIVDCCNGLFLLEEYEAIVVNPTTWRSARLPPCNDLPKGHMCLGFYRSYLAFDPTVSPHYEVISMQHPFDAIEWNRLQWPPPVYILRAYSSRTGRWEVRRFALEGLQRSIDGALMRDYGDGHAAYWRGVLYVHCYNHFILRINLSDNKYQVIDLPIDATGSDALCEFYLGKSKNGIYFAAILNETCGALVWFLDESNGKAQWVLKHGINLHDLVTHLWHNPDAQTHRPCILQDNDSHKEIKLGPAVEVEKNLRNLGWESDDEESIVDIKNYRVLTMEEKNNVDWDTNDEGAMGITGYRDTENTYKFALLGFHPYKEIVFLHSSRVVSYHFSTSKVRDLGELGIKYPERIGSKSFIYAPCWVETCENS